MALPKRKSIRLKTYDYSQNGAYFITICTKDKRNILWETNVGATCGRPNETQHLSDIRKIIDSEINKIKSYYDNVSVNKYVIMPNHIHMIIVIDNQENGTMWASSPTQSIPQMIKSLKTFISKEIDFSIFQRSYYDHIIRNEKDYERICEYIDTNPMKWREDEYYAENS